MSDISERHRKALSPSPFGHCAECQRDWPCDTAIETARADKAEADAAALADGIRDWSDDPDGIYHALDALAAHEKQVKP